MEESARIAKENSKSLADRRAQYTTAAPTVPVAAKPAETAEPKQEVKEKEEKKRPYEKKKPSFKAMQPIYTEDELKEIEEEELEEEMSASWNEDVDYEEYDEYYDDEYSRAKRSHEKMRSDPGALPEKGADPGCPHAGK